MANLGQSLLKERTQDRALVHDPVLNGHKELLKIYILKPTFRAFEEHKRHRYVKLKYLLDSCRIINFSPRLVRN